MHKIFGNKQELEYTDRQGAYLIPVQDGKVAVVQVPKGYFLLGGGLHGNESHSECINRECIEEAGIAVKIGERVCSAESFGVHPQIGPFHPIQTYYVGEVLGRVTVPCESDHTLVWLDISTIKGKLYLEMQNWALEQYIEYMSRKERKQVT